MECCNELRGVERGGDATGWRGSVTTTLVVRVKRGSGGGGIILGGGSSFLGGVLVRLRG